MITTRSIGALALAAAVLLALPIPAAAVSDLLPDLKMAPLYDVSLEYKKSGKVRLRFGTIVMNIGQGPLEARGNKRIKGHMTEIRQVIHSSTGSTRSVTPPNVTGFYAGDGHNHWHLSQFVVATLYPAEAAGPPAPSAVRSLHKIGFCLTDSLRVPEEIRPPNSAPRRAYPWTGCGNSNSTHFKMGISVGWADEYPAWIAHQWVEVTNLPEDDYRLCATPNPVGDWLELDQTNNSAWIDVHLNVAAKQVSIIGQGDTDCQPAAAAALTAAFRGAPAALYCPIETETALDRRLGQL
ncbi:MAG: hypothetical protein QOJ81_1820 [Chloroflexota bacterium]|nr:hypothetical protein [Chloroflexota bacterium]